MTMHCKQTGKALAAIMLMSVVAFFALGGCRAAPPPPQAVAPSGSPTAGNPIVIDKATGEVRIAARTQAKYYDTPTWHGVVWVDGGAGGEAIFQAYVSDRVFHEALVFIGAQPANNLQLPGYPESKDGGQLWGDYNKMPEYAGQHVEGPKLDVLISWEGAPRPYHLHEVLSDPEGEQGKGVEVRFGGNYNYIEVFGSGCFTCLYSCPGGKTSNSVYSASDFHRHDDAGTPGFRGRADLLPPDGTDVVITYRLT